MSQRLIVLDEAEEELIEAERWYESTKHSALVLVKSFEPQSTRVWSVF